MSKQPKTIAERLEKLPEPQRTNALIMTRLSGNMNKPSADIKDALHRAFNWGRTPLGHGYWKRLYSSL